MGLERMLKKNKRDMPDEAALLRRIAENFFADMPEVKIELEIADAAIAISRELFEIPKIYSLHEFSLDEKKDALNYLGLLAIGLETFESEHGILKYLLPEGENKDEG